MIKAYLAANSGKENAPAGVTAAAAAAAHTALAAAHTALAAAHTALAATVTAMVEPALADAEAGFVCQFERLGYFVADCVDHRPGQRPVFNRTVALRDSWSKNA